MPQILDRSQVLQKTVGEYLHSAAIELARDRQFKPTTETDLVLWLNENLQGISSRAIDMQRSDSEMLVLHRKDISPLLALHILEGN